MNPYTITVTRHDDGTFTADGFPDVIEIDPQLIEQANPALLRAEGERLFFTFANGNAEYRIDGRIGPFALRALKVS